MQDPGIDVLINKVGSAYKLVVIAAQRAIELSEGAAKLVDMKQDAKATNIALQEILDGKVSYKVKGEK